MVRIRAEGMHGMFEANFDFKAQTIEADDVDGHERAVGGHQDDHAAFGVLDQNKVHGLAGGVPQEVDGVVFERDVFLAVDRAFDLNEI